MAKNNSNLTLTLGIKILLLALMTAVLGFMAYVAFLGGEWLIGGVLSLVLVLANVIYSTNKYHLICKTASNDGKAENI
jgi:hypothetical protein